VSERGSALTAEHMSRGDGILVIATSVLEPTIRAVSATGDVVSHLEMCQQVGATLQQGMNFRPHGRTSVFLMSRRAGAPYRDSVDDEGRVLTYEGHDVPRVRGGPDQKPLIKSCSRRVAPLRRTVGSSSVRNCTKPASKRNSCACTRKSEQASGSSTVHSA
jgi:hypothetical protein